MKEKRRLHTTDELRELIRSVRSGTFEYEERSGRSLDWSSYDEAQAYELADMLYLIRNSWTRLPIAFRRRRRGVAGGLPSILPQTSRRSS